MNAILVPSGDLAVGAVVGCAVAVLERAEAASVDVDREDIDAPSV
jgi:hypothetical protein